MQIAHLSRREVYHPRAPLSGGVDESFTGRSLEFSLVRTLVVVFYVCQGLTRMTMAFLVSRPVASLCLDDKYVGLELTLIGCIETSAIARLES